MNVRVSELMAHVNWINQINREQLSEIHWFDDAGQEIEIPRDRIDEFVFCGLNNVDFITTGFYKDARGNGDD